MADVVNAFVNSPNYRRGALFVIYDEWGGFFDHVRPPRVVDNRASRDLEKDFGQMGFRIPAVAVSPYARGTTRRRNHFRVDHGLFGHESILKLISYRFRLGYLNRRHRYARNIARSFDWEHPDFDPPTLPDPPHIVTTPCAVGGDGGVFDAKEAHANDLAGLESLAHRFQLPVYEGRPDQIFTKPDSVKQGLHRHHHGHRHKHRQAR